MQVQISSNHQPNIVWTGKRLCHPNPNPNCMSSPPRPRQANQKGSQGDSQSERLTRRQPIRKTHKETARKTGRAGIPIKRVVLDEWISPYYHFISYKKIGMILVQNLLVVVLVSFFQVFVLINCRAWWSELKAELGFTSFLQYSPRIWRPVS